MNLTRRLQTIAPGLSGMFRLRGSGSSQSKRRRIGSRRDNRFILATMTNVNAIVIQIQNDYYGNIYVSFAFYDTSNTYLGITTVPLAVSDIVANGLNATVLAAIAAAAVTDSYTVLSTLWSVAATTGPNSYQTIVSQTGTAAPAVSGSLAPSSTYPSGTTFTWARTGTGVYTLTASTAVFNTSGKTGVFVGSLNNLNASYKAVVTSSTVITITTAIGSLLGLGLLGLTATNTDALLSNTMVYVQTYA